MYDCVAKTGGPRESSVGAALVGAPPLLHSPVDRGCRNPTAVSIRPLVGQRGGPSSTWPHALAQPTGTRPRRAGAKQKKKAKAHDRKERRDTRRSIEIASANDTAAGKRQSDRSADEERTESVLLARMSTEDQLLQKQAIVYDCRQLESPAERSHH